MRRVLFLLSHLCSGSEILYNSLDQHPRIQGFRSNRTYENRLSLHSLTSQDHKLDNASAIYMDELLFNHCIGHKSIYPECKYVFILRDPKDTLNEIVETRNYTPAGAANYYKFRLRRLTAIARKSPDAVLLTHSDLERGLGGDLIASYLHLREPVQILRSDSMNLDNAIPLPVLADVSDYFEKTLYGLRRLGLSATS